MTQVVDEAYLRDDPVTEIVPSSVRYRVAPRNTNQPTGDLGEAVLGVLARNLNTGEPLKLWTTAEVTNELDPFLRRTNRYRRAVRECLPRLQKAGQIESCGQFWRVKVVPEETRNFRPRTDPNIDVEVLRTAALSWLECGDMSQETLARVVVRANPLFVYNKVHLAISWLKKDKRVIHDEATGLLSLP